MAVKGTYLIIAGIGGIFLWSGIKGKSVTSVVRLLIGGQDPSTAATTNQIAGTDYSSLANVVTGQSGLNPKANIPGGAVPVTSGTPNQNQAIARTLLAVSHPTWAVGQEWQDLVSLWNRESGWSNVADTRVSGLDPPDASVFAYGIAQARPYSKYPKLGWPKDKGGVSDVISQITWGIAYIANTYGDPSSAWAHETSNGWY
jgi:hypothetical protein